jgi:peptidoglycan-associated lipoprotein
MSVLRRFGSVSLVLVLTAVLAACASGTKAPGSEAEGRIPTVREGEAPIQEEVVVREPEVEPRVSEEVTEELPEDLQELNRRGYLQDVFFETDRYDLTTEARENLTRNATWLQQFPTVQILVEGHCDERNTREYNLALGERRANAVRNYLVFLGVGAHRVRTISYGEERPFALGHDESAWRLNRRDHFVITAR